MTKIKIIASLILILCCMPQAKTQIKSINDYSFAEIDTLVIKFRIKQETDSMLIFAKMGVSKATATLSKDDTTYARMLFLLGESYRFSEIFTESEQYFKAAIDIQSRKIPLSPNYALSLNNLGILYMNFGYYDLAEAAHKKALKIRQQIGGEQHIDCANSLNNLAILYKITARYDLAEPLYKEAAEIRRKIVGENHLDYASSLNNLANLYWHRGDYTLAESLHKKTLRIRKDILGDKHIAYATSLFNLAGLYTDMKKYDLAEPLHIESMQIRKNILGNKHPNYANSLNNLATLYKDSHRFDLAEPLMLEATAIYAEVFGKYHSDYIMSVVNLAELYKSMNNTPKAWAYVQDLMNSNSGGHISININQAWADSLASRTYINTENMFSSLNIAYELLSSENTPEAKEKQVIITELALRILRKERDNFSEEGDKLRSLKGTNTWVLNGLKLLDSDIYAEKAFVLAEQSKSVLLLNAAQTQQAYTFGDLPDSLIQKEKHLQQQKTVYEAGILEVRPKHEIDSLRNLLNKLNLNIIEFARNIEKSYPKYAALKYQQKDANIADIQKLLSPNTALIEYVVGDSTTYIFYLDKKQLKISRFHITSDSLNIQAQKLQHCLSNYDLIKDDEAQAYTNYTQIAHWFYQNILAQPLQNAQNITHLIIIPDGDLSHLPFETFLTTAADPKGNYSQLAYLVNDFSISYNYSASLWKENLAQQNRQNNGLMLGFVANYAIKLDSNKFDQRLPADLRLRNFLRVLPAAQKEVESLSQHFKGYFAFDNLASEQEFKSKASKYSIIHLAMHGLLDERNPILSSLAFTENGDSSENNFLHAYEISKMQLNADLVVLSACETGFGKFEQGNGTASLARAFMYAGVPALVVSLWAVNDGSTNILMQSFYSNLATGMDKAEALRQAKLEYIRNAKGKAAHPAFWSAFVQLGDSQPINIYNNNSNWYIWAILAAILLGLAAILGYKFIRK